MLAAAGGVVCGQLPVIRREGAARRICKTDARVVLFHALLGGLTDFVGRPVHDAEMHSGQVFADDPECEQLRS